MARFYSQSTGCTYLTEIHGKNMPADALAIGEEVYLAVIASPAPGKIRSHVGGLPVLIDPSPPTAEDLAEDERRWRDRELSALVWMRDRHRDQLEIGAVATLTAEQFAELLVYMQQLRDWPQTPEFPDASVRPLAPPWIAEQTP